MNMAVTKKFDILEQGMLGGWMVYAMFFSMGKKHDKGRVYYAGRKNENRFI